MEVRLDMLKALARSGWAFLQRLDPASASMWDSSAVVPAGRSRKASSSAHLWWHCKDCIIEKESTMHLVLRLRGGMQGEVRLNH